MSSKTDVEDDAILEYSTPAALYPYWRRMELGIISKGSKDDCGSMAPSGASTTTIKHCCFSYTPQMETSNGPRGPWQWHALICVFN